MACEMHVHPHNSQAATLHLSVDGELPSYLITSFVNPRWLHSQMSTYCKDHLPDVLGFHTSL